MTVLMARHLTLLEWLLHGFSTRSGGASRLGGKRVLNLGFTDWDARATVEANRELFLATLGGNKMALTVLHQIHSDVIHLVEKAPDAPLRGDALISNTPGVLLGVQTADCVPVLLADTRRRAVAAIHAGWRGTLARIAAKTIGRMSMEFGTRPADVVAAIGPAIHRCSYEVGPEVAQAFAGQFPQAREWFDVPRELSSGMQDGEIVAGEGPNPLKWLLMTPPGNDPPPPSVQLDLVAANRWQLVDAGVRAANISSSELCTACRTDLLFSHRRERGRTGRMMAVIGIRV
ncbi:MAG: peptidoglycan editing factor PgeF [Candidatus Acidiferrales bacterium]